MKKICAVLSIALACALAGCADLRQDVRMSRVDTITPSGCIYIQKYNEFDCTDTKQETYLRMNGLTDADLKTLGDLSGAEDDVLAIFTRLHDCVIKLKPTTYICTYEFSADVLDRFNKKVNVEESKDGEKFVYVFREK